MHGYTRLYGGDLNENGSFDEGLQNLAWGDLNENSNFDEEKLLSSHAWLQN